MYKDILVLCNDGEKKATGLRLDILCWLKENHLQFKCTVWQGKIASELKNMKYFDIVVTADPLIPQESGTPTIQVQPESGQKGKNALYARLRALIFS